MVSKTQETEFCPQPEWARKWLLHTGVQQGGSLRRPAHHQDLGDSQRAVGSTSVLSRAARRVAIRYGGSRQPRPLEKVLWALPLVQLASRRSSADPPLMAPQTGLGSTREKDWEGKGAAHSLLPVSRQRRADAQLVPCSTQVRLTCSLLPVPGPSVGPTSWGGRGNRGAGSLNH